MIFRIPKNALVYVKSIHTTATFDDGFSKLKDRKAFSAFRLVSIVPKMATSAIASLSMAVFRKCELIVVPVTVFISSSVAWK